MLAMSHINHKGPKRTQAPTPFEPLNNRKNARPKSETIGQTYGERRHQATFSEASDWLKTGFNRAKDFFLGTGKKSNHIENFANKDDGYLGTNLFRDYAKSAVEKKTQLEAGIKQIAKPASQQYVHFLDSVITYLAPQKSAAKPAKK